MPKVDLAIRADRNLKKAAQKLFGKSNVSAAYIATHYHEHVGKKVSIEALKRLRYTPDSSRGLDFDGVFLIIVINNKPLLFSSSEWGSISEIDMATTIEL